MLPDRSKRYASTEGEIPRLGLTSTWQLLLLAFLMLGLLYLIYPRNALVEQLYEQDRLDDLTLSYIRNLYRADIRNADAAILLAKLGAEKIETRALEQMLLPFTDASDQRQRNQARMTLLQTYERMLSEGTTRQEERRIQSRLTELMQKALDDELSLTLAQQFSMLAFRLNLPRYGRQFMQRTGSELTFQSLEERGHAALSRGQHELAAQYFLLARDKADNMTAARRLFQLGIGAYMSGGYYRQAMRAAEQHLGTLEDDLPTLRYLVKTCLAAGEPMQAARYARRLVFRLPSEFGRQPS